MVRRDGAAKASRLAASRAREVSWGRGSTKILISTVRLARRHFGNSVMKLKRRGGDMGHVCLGLLGLNIGVFGHGGKPWQW